MPFNYLKRIKDALLDAYLNGDLTKIIHLEALKENFIVESKKHNYAIE